MSPEVFVWEGREYEHEPKSADWYWAVGIIAAALTIAAILFSNYLLAGLVVIAAVAITLHAAKEPPVHRFTLSDRGLVIGSELFPYEVMRSFALLEYVEGDRPPVLSIKTESWLSPHLVIPLNDVDAEALYHHLLTRVREEEHPHTFADLVAAWLGF